MGRHTCRMNRRVGIMSSTRSCRLSAVLVLLVLSACAVRESESGTFGEWTCSAGTTVVSSGDFVDSEFAPFVSPEVTTGPTACQNKYHADLDCTYEFRAPANHIAVIEFTAVTLDSECSEDFIDIDLQDGIRRLCGAAGATWDIADGDTITMTFTTSAENQCSGFAGFFSSFLDPAAKKRRRRSVPESPQLKTLTSVDVPKLRGPRRTEYRYSRDVLQYLLTVYQKHHARHLQECREMMQEIWEHDHCSICTSEHVNQCYCIGDVDEEGKAYDIQDADLDFEVQGYTGRRRRRRRHILESKMLSAPLSRHRRSDPCDCRP
eukprot:scpid29039/ scgid35372/ 